MCDDFLSDMLDLNLEGGADVADVFLLQELMEDGEESDDED